MSLKCRFAIVVASLLFLCGASDRAFSAAPEFKLDHFKVYKMKVEKTTDVVVALQGQFDKRPLKTEIKGPALIANPVSKNGGKIRDEGAHMTVYFIAEAEREPARALVVRNQFFKYEPHKLLIGDPRYLMVPTAKLHDGRDYPVSRRLDHYKCYEVLEGEVAKVPVKLIDQFEKTENVALKPVLFGVPVTKIHNDMYHKIQNERDHLVIYELERHDSKPVAKIGTADQFGRRGGEVYTRMWLCVPTAKLEFKEVKRR